MNESFDKLDNEFNVLPTERISKSEVVNTETGEIIEAPSTAVAERPTPPALEDKEYLQQQTKDIIDNSKEVLRIVQQDIKIGSPAKQIEAYAKLMTSHIEGLRELRELNKTVADMQVFTEPESTKTSINIKLTGKELIAMMKEAKESSQIKAVDANFSVEGEPKDER